LLFVNSGEGTRFNTHTGDTSVLDLSFCSASLATILQWQVLSSPYGSDYFPIIIKNPTKTYNTLPIPKWNLQNANWEIFQNLIVNNINTVAYLGFFSTWIIKTPT
jgi:hypothetical protein